MPNRRVGSAAFTASWTALHQRGHVCPPPCGQGRLRPLAANCAASMAGIGGGVEVIVKVDAVHGVVLHQLGHALHHIVGSCRHRRGSGKAPSSTVQTHSGWVLARLLVRKVRRHGRRGAQPVGVDPRFHRNAPGVGLRAAARPAGQSPGPCPCTPVHRWLHGNSATAVQRIPEGAHLGQHCVQPQCRCSCPAAAATPARKASSVEKSIAAHSR